MGPVVTDGSTVTVIVHPPYVGITRSGSYGRRPRAVLSAHSACAPASSCVVHASATGRRCAARPWFLSNWCACCANGVMIGDVHEAAQTSADTGGSPAGPPAED